MVEWESGALRNSSAERWPDFFSELAGAALVVELGADVASLDADADADVDSEGWATTVEVIGSLVPDEQALTTSAMPMTALGKSKDFIRSSLHTPST